MILHPSKQSMVDCFVDAAWGAEPEVISRRSMQQTYLLSFILVS